MDKLLVILEGIRSDVDFRNLDKLLIDDNILDSFDIIAIVGEINEAFDVDISADELLPENFNTPTAMMELINKLLEED